MNDFRQTLLLIGLAGLFLAASLYGHRHGSPDPTVMLAIMVAAMGASIAGIGFSAIGGAILLHLVDDPVRLTQLLTVCGLANHAITVWSLRPTAAWRGLGPLLAGGAAGIGPGLWTLLHAEHRLVTHAAGVAGVTLSGGIGMADLLCIPAGLLGTQIGLTCARGLTDRQFAIALALILGVCGLGFWV